MYSTVLVLRQLTEKVLPIPFHSLKSLHVQVKHIIQFFPETKTINEYNTDINLFVPLKKKRGKVTIYNYDVLANITASIHPPFASFD